MSAGRERVTLRPAVRRFAEAMERALRKHDGDRGRRGWAKDGRRALFRRLQEELDELEFALGDYSPRRELRKEAVDVGNFAMMLFDVSR
jgi:hypothetical protein